MILYSKPWTISPLTIVSTVRPCVMTTYKHIKWNLNEPPILSIFFKYTSGTWNVKYINQSTFSLLFILCEIYPIIVLCFEGVFVPKIIRLMMFYRIFSVEASLVYAIFYKCFFSTDRGQTIITTGIFLSRAIMKMFFLI